MSKEKKITALNDFVFLAWEKEEEQKEGIIASDVSREKPATAVVVAVGPDVKQIKEGDEVIVDPFQPRKLSKVKGKDYFIIREKYVYGKI